jgi:hypothetical protein
MDEKQYNIWWKLHLRAALGNTLTEEEQRVYDSGREELEAEERVELRQDLAEWRALQTRLRELTMRNQELARQEALLRERAAQLEQQYLGRTGQKLGLEV